MAAAESAAHGVRAAYPFLSAPRTDRVRWACLLECGHTVELELLPGDRPRRSACPACAARERTARRPPVLVAPAAAASRQLGFWFDLEA